MAEYIKSYRSVKQSDTLFEPTIFLIYGSVIRNLYVHLKGMFLQNDHLNAEKQKVLRMTNVFGSFGSTKERTSSKY